MMLGILDETQIDTKKENALMKSIKMIIKCLCIFILFVFLSLNSQSRAAYLEDNLNRIWFEDIKSKFSVSNSEATWLMKYVEKLFKEERVASQEIPKVFKKDLPPRIVFISVSDGKTMAHVSIGSGLGVMKAVNQAASNLKLEVGNNFHVKWIKLDIVQEVFPLENTVHEKLLNFRKPLRFNRTLFGLALSNPFYVSFLPEEIVSERIISESKRVQLHRFETYLSEKLILSSARGKSNKSLNALLNKTEYYFDKGKVKPYCFTVLSFFSDGLNIFPLYGGKKLDVEITRQNLFQSIRLASDYLKNAVKRDGTFVYIYYPETDEESKDYNISRHAGAIYNMLELYELSKDKKLLDAIKKAIDYFLTQQRTCKENEKNTICIVENEGYLTPNGVAVGAIVLAKYILVTNDKKYFPIMIKFGNWLKNRQYDKRRIDLKYVNYPGEALLGLVRIYSVDPDEKWLDAAEKGAQFLIKERDNKVSDDKLNPDHWLLYTLNELYRYRPNPLYLNHVIRLSKVIIKKQTKESKFPDLIGGYSGSSAITSIATKLEGLCSAYNLLHDYDKKKEANEILNSMKLATQFLLRGQFKPESVMYFQNPRKAIGGFHQSLNRFDIEIDYLQHSVSGIVGLYKILGELKLLPSMSKHEIPEKSF